MLTIYKSDQQNSRRLSGLIQDHNVMFASPINDGHWAMELTWDGFTRVFDGVFTKELVVGLKMATI